MFCVPLWSVIISDWGYKKKKLLEIARESEFSKPPSDQETTLTSFYGGSNKFTDRVSETLKEELETFCQIVGWSSLRLDGSWFQKSKKGNFIGPHNHGSVGYSAALYIEYKSEEHTPVTLVSPFLNFENGCNISYTPPGVTEGTLIVFPSSIIHYTIPSITDRERLVLSFNILKK